MPSSPQNAASGAHSSLHLSTHALFEQFLDELKAAWRFKWQALAVAWLIAVAGWAVIAAMPNVYSASARVFVDGSSRLRPLLHGLAVDTDVDAQLGYVKQVLLSRPNLEHLVDVSGLSAKVSSSDQKSKLISSLKDRIDIVVTASGMDPEGGRVYRINFDDPDRQTALTIVKSLLEHFVEGSRDSSKAQSAEAQNFLTTQLSELETKLAAAESRLAEFKKRNVGLLPGQGGDYFSRVQNEREGLARAKSALQLLESQRDELQAQLRGELPRVASAGASMVANAPRDIDARIKESEAKLEELLLKYTDRHPEVIQLQETIADLKSRRAQELDSLKQGGPGTGSMTYSDNPLYQSIRLQLNKVEVDIAASRREIDQRTRQIRELEQLLGTAPDVEAELVRLNRDYGATKLQYEALLERLQKAQLSEQADETGTVKLKVIDPPTAAADPVGPKRMMLLVAVLLAALGGGGACAFALQQIKPVFSSASSLTQVTGIPTLAAIGQLHNPAVEEHERAALVRFLMGTGALIALFVVVVATRDMTAALFHKALG